MKRGDPERPESEAEPEAAMTDDEAGETGSPPGSRRRDEGRGRHDRGEGSGTRPGRAAEDVTPTLARTLERIAASLEAIAGILTRADLGRAEPRRPPSRPEFRRWPRDDPRGGSGESRGGYGGESRGGSGESRGGYGGESRGGFREPRREDRGWQRRGGPRRPR
jgi:hypothetical protein